MDAVFVELANLSMLVVFIKEAQCLSYSAQ